MKKLHRFLIMSVLVSMLVGMGAIVSSAAAAAEPVKVLADYDGSKKADQEAGGASANVEEKYGNKYYSMDFPGNTGDLNKETTYIDFGASQYAFLGKGDYLITDYDFMADDWAAVSCIGMGWDVGNHQNSANRDMWFTLRKERNGTEFVDSEARFVASDKTVGIKGTYEFIPENNRWYHMTIVVKFGGPTKNMVSGALSTAQLEDGTEGYAYIDGQLFAKFLIGDTVTTGSNPSVFWSANSTYFRAFRVSGSSFSGPQHLNVDNIYIAQYEESRELREFFRYRTQNGGAFPDLHAVEYPFIKYNADYPYPPGEPKCKVVEMSGNEVAYDRFDKAVKYAATRSGSKVVLLAPIEDASIQEPLRVEVGGYAFDYTLSPSLRTEEVVRVNPLTGVASTELNFIKKTKYAFYKWAVDHTGEVFDSRGYTPLLVDSPVVYEGEEFKRQYYLDGILYTFTGNWHLYSVEGAVLTSVPTSAINSYYVLFPEFKTESLVYAMIEDAEGVVEFATKMEDVASLIAGATPGSVVTLLGDVSLSAPLAINAPITLDLAGFDLTVKDASAFLLSADAQGTVITSSKEGAVITGSTSVFEAACGFTLDGANVLAKAASLIKVDASISDVVINGGSFVLSGNYVLDLGAGASINADIDATVIAKDALLADAARAYEVTLGGAILGVKIPASEKSTVVLSKGLALTYSNSFAGATLPEGVSLADAALVIAAKKQTVAVGDASADANYLVADALDVVLLVWAEDVKEYVAAGETVYYDYADYYDAKLFYRHSTNRTYAFAAEGVDEKGNVVDAAWAGLTIEVTPFYDSMSFYLVAVKPDGSCDPYTDPADLTALMLSGEYEDGTTFAIGKKNVFSIENLVLKADYVLDLNGYAIPILGINEINGGSLKIYSSREGAAFGSDLAQAFTLKNGATLEIDGENLGYYGKMLATLDSASALKIAGGVFVVEGDFYKAEAGATVEISGIAANAELFAAAAGYAWTAVEETAKVYGIECEITARYDAVAE